MPLLLASASPRRRQLLRRAGVRFRVWNPGEDPPLPHLGSWQAATLSALVKACRGAAAFPGYLSLGADTVVVLGGRTLGKPRDAAEAREMLAALSGRAHEVYTAFGLAASFPSPRRKIAVFWLEVVRSEVYFRRLSATEIAEYVATGAPLDKAGAYGIQDPSHKLVERVRGSYYNVVGLPLRQVLRALRTVESRCP